MNNTLLKILSIATLPFTIVACSSSSSDSNGSSSLLDARVVNLASIQVLDAKLNNNLEFTGIFFKADEPFLISELTDSTTTSVTQDSCDIIIAESEEEFEGFVVDDITLNPVNAGEVINVSGPSGSIADIALMPAIGLFYTGRTQLTDETASDLVIDIPGADFPAVSNIAVPNVEPFLLTSHEADDPFPLSIDSVVTWEASTGSNSGVWLYSSLESSTTDSEGNESTVFVELDCKLVDDGQFVLSEAIQSQLREAGIDKLRFNMAREVGNFQVIGDTLVAVLRHSGDV